MLGALSSQKHEQKTLYNHDCPETTERISNFLIVALGGERRSHKGYILSITSKGVAINVLE